MGYYLLEVLTDEFGPNVDKLPQEDKRWTLFQKLWDVMMNAVAPWIWEQGGWVGQLAVYCPVIDIVCASSRHCMLDKWLEIKVSKVEHSRALLMLEYLCIFLL